METPGPRVFYSPCKATSRRLQCLTNLNFCRKLICALHGKIVPEYLYWQDGYLNMKVNVWTNHAVAGWCKSRLVYNTYPRPINYEPNPTSSTTGLGITYESRYRYGNNSPTPTYGGWFLHTSRNSGRFEFPQMLTPSLMSTVDWMKNGPW